MNRILEEHILGTSNTNSLNASGLFAGIGGIELGLEQAGHSTVEFCEIDPSAQSVLSARFADIPICKDVRDYDRLPKAADLVTAGFPCQDLSQAGRTLGIEGSKSGVVGELFRLLRVSPVPWVLIENVSFMLRLQRGRGVDLILSNLEDLGYRWAYRVVDTRSFGLPQRRRRVFILATLEGDPRDVLLSDDAGPVDVEPKSGSAFGFYWTEGTRGLGWAVDATPTLKGGSGLGIPSPPAIWWPSGLVGTPEITVAERLQGFSAGWTDAAESRSRWQLVGNAVTVDVAEWIGRRLRKPRPYATLIDPELRKDRPWPKAAYNVGDGRLAASVSEWPVRSEVRRLSEFMDEDDLEPLSARATRGFLSRFEKSSLRKPSGFVDALRAHLVTVEEGEVVGA